MTSYLGHWKILHSKFPSSPLPWSSSTVSSLVRGVSAVLGELASPVSPSQWTVGVFWLERRRRRGATLWSPWLNDWETPEPPLANPSPQPWRDPSLRRPPEPERMVGVPGTEMSGSAFLMGEGEVGALRGSETVWNWFLVITKSHVYKGHGGTVTCWSFNQYNQCTRPSALWFLQTRKVLYKHCFSLIVAGAETN